MFLCLFFFKLFCLFFCCYRCFVLFCFVFVFLSFHPKLIFLCLIVYSIKKKNKKQKTKTKTKTPTTFVTDSMKIGCSLGVIVKNKCCHFPFFSVLTYMTRRHTEIDGVYCRNNPTRLTLELLKTFYQYSLKLCFYFF